VDILPAIDIRDGACVRLRQGDYGEQINYNNNPSFVAKAFQMTGAKWIHCVDLDGARTGKPTNIDQIEKIVRETKLNVQVGGGVRDEEAISTILGYGARRVVVGTMALDDMDRFSALARKPELAEKIVLGIDARDGKVAREGWTDTTGLDAAELAEQVAELPLAAIVYTDISRDGMMEGPNLDSIERMAEAASAPLIASGGVTTIDDIKALARLPIAGIIIGRALYEGAIDLEAALEAVSG
jgi:phosphoribosylformimino-5-aminoimidazole carboxamide ribotide isomerase